MSPIPVEELSRKMFFQVLSTIPSELLKFGRNPGSRKTGFGDRRFQPIPAQRSRTHSPFDRPSAVTSPFLFVRRSPNIVAMFHRLKALTRERHNHLGVVVESVNMPTHENIRNNLFGQAVEVDRALCHGSPSARSVMVEKIERAPPIVNLMFPPDPPLIPSLPRYPTARAESPTKSIQEIRFQIVTDRGFVIPFGDQRDIVLVRIEVFFCGFNEEIQVIASRVFREYC